MKKTTELRELFEDVVVGMAYAGFFETPQKTTWHRLLRRESDGQEIFISIYDFNEKHADTPITIRFKGKN